MEQRLSLITLGVDDIARSRRFYERLGWTASKLGGDEVAFFQLGGIILSIWSREALAADLLGKEVAVFVPTCTTANLIALLALVPRSPVP